MQIYKPKKTLSKIYWESDSKILQHQCCHHKKNCLISLCALSSEWFCTHLVCLTNVIYYFVSGNIALHIFSRKARPVYDLESLWSLGSEYDLNYNKPDDPLITLLEQHSVYLGGLRPADGIIENTNGWKFMFKICWVECSYLWQEVIFVKHSALFCK